MLVAAAVLTPEHFRAVTAEAQGDGQAPRMFVQHAQVELHQVPADDGVGVVGGQPLVQALQQLPTTSAVLQLEVDCRVRGLGPAEHIHLALAAAFQGDGIQLALGVGFDVQGDQAQGRAIVRRGL